MPDFADKPWNWQPLEEPPRRVVDPQEEIRARKAAIGRQFQKAIAKPQVERRDDDKPR